MATKKTASAKKTAAKKSAAKKSAAKKSGAAAKAAKSAFPAAPTVAAGSPAHYRVRVRMYRHGLGDCFLLTFPRKDRAPYQMLIDCGVLGRDKTFISGMVSHLRDSIRDAASNPTQKARLDAVVATHEHRDHLSGFNQARKLFNDDFDFGAVLLGWTENLTVAEAQKIKEAKKKAIATLHAALAGPVKNGAGLAGMEELLGFSDAEDVTESDSIAKALEYLKVRGKEAGDLRFLEPGSEPFSLDGVEGVRVYVLGPPKNPRDLKGSEVTEKMKHDGTIYHLGATGDAGMDALMAAVADPGANNGAGERYFPFADEHRIPRNSPYFRRIRQFVADTYDRPDESWRKIDEEWQRGFGQLALDLDNDTNNTSLVLAFEFVKTGEVLLFVGDAQVGNWKSWADVKFAVPGRATPLPAHDLLARTVFYKVGHHCSHNATLRNGGLELMSRPDLVAFIPLDKPTAANQGKKGWDMPAGPLFRALNEKAAKRVVISDAAEPLQPEAEAAGVRATAAYVDYFLK